MGWRETLVGDVMLEERKKGKSDLHPQMRSSDFSGSTGIIRQASSTKRLCISAAPKEQLDSKSLEKQEPLASCGQALAEDEIIKLLALAGLWQMDAEEIGVMFRQCQRGGEAAGVRFTAKEARAFWFGEAGKAQ